jgi:uncharacterized HAD superfamily protein/adenine/guanine phosphoribosyltransferase-like PRPP-binding protein
MHYRSIADLQSAITGNLHRLPRDLDLVVGVPRSGLLAANLLSLATNIPMTDLDGFVAGRLFSSGSTKSRAAVSSASAARRVLVLDDSINSGAAMRDARAKVAAAGSAASIFFAAVYGLPKGHNEVDYVFEEVPQPRLFQWNVMHHVSLERSCVDMDGVICADPTGDENDDGPAYERFLRSARLLQRPSRRIGCIVTSRLERYRASTQAWLASNGVRYDRLIMLNLRSKKERQRLSAHATFKAQFYRDSDAILFIESEYAQAARIADASGKPVLCTETQKMILPVSRAKWLRWDRASAFLASSAAYGPANTVSLDDKVQDSAPDIGYVLIDPHTQSQPRTLVSCLGPIGENVADVIGSVSEACLRRSEFPVVLMSELRPELMKSFGAPVEFLPTLKHVRALKLDHYQRYVKQRWALILEKWKIKRQITLGASLDEFLASSPSGDLNR